MQKLLSPWSWGVSFPLSRYMSVFAHLKALQSYPTRIFIEVSSHRYYRLLTLSLSLLSSQGLGAATGNSKLLIVVWFSPWPVLI